MPRLVTCHVCGIIQRMIDPPKGVQMVPAILRWTDGTERILKNEDNTPKMVPQFDPLLEEFVTAHDHQDLMDDKTWLDRAVVECVQVDQRTWDSQDVTTKLKKELKNMTGNWYEERDTYREDAIGCYNKHGNPTPSFDGGSGCSDYRTDGKIIGGKQKVIDGRTYTVPHQFRQFLCDMCPYTHAYVNVELRRRKGYYDNKKALPRKQ